METKSRDDIRSAVTPRVMRARQAAEYLGVGQSAIWAMAARGEIESVKIAARTTVFLVESLDALIESRRSGAATRRKAPTAVAA